MYLSSQTLRARTTATYHINNHATTAFRLIAKSQETKEAVAELVSDPSLFSAVLAKLQTIPYFPNIVETAKRMTKGATSCLIPRDREDLVEENEISSDAERSIRWAHMFRMVVEGVTGMWNELVDMFTSTIPRIQAAFAREGDVSGDTHAMETAMIITGLVVLVAAVIIVGAVLVH